MRFVVTTWYLVGWGFVGNWTTSRREVEPMIDSCNNPPHLLLGISVNRRH